jgi:RNA polymerase sporulation-specific sigma factor
MTVFDDGIGDSFPWLALATNGSGPTLLYYAKRCTVIGEMNVGHLREKAARMAFPEKTNPNRPVPAAGGPWRETRGEARPFPEKCHPNRSHQPLTDEQRALVTRYMPMARALAAQLEGTAIGIDELEAEAYAALIQAAQTFDETRGANFAVYAQPRILGALRDYRRFLFHANWRGEPSESPVFQRLSPTDDLHGQVIGKQPEAPLGQDFESVEAVEQAIRFLPRAEAVTCRLIYLDGKSQDEVAEVLDCSKGRLSRLHQKALERLRLHYRKALAG